MLLARFDGKDTGKIEILLALCSLFGVSMEWIPEPRPKSEIQATINTDGLVNKEELISQLKDNGINV